MTAPCVRGTVMEGAKPIRFEHLLSRLHAIRGNEPKLRREACLKSASGIGHGGAEPGSGPRPLLNHQPSHCYAMRTSVSGSVS